MMMKPITCAIFSILLLAIKVFKETIVSEYIIVFLIFYVILIYLVCNMFAHLLRITESNDDDDGGSHVSTTLFIVTSIVLYYSMRLGLTILVLEFFLMDFLYKFFIKQSIVARIKDRYGVICYDHSQLVGYMRIEENEHYVDKIIDNIINKGIGNEKYIIIKENSYTGKTSFCVAPKIVQNFIDSYIISTPILFFSFLQNKWRVSENFNTKDFVEQLYPDFLKDIIIWNNAFVSKSETEKKLQKLISDKDFFTVKELEYSFNLDKIEFIYDYTDLFKLICTGFNFSFLPTSDGAGVFVNDERLTEYSCAYCNCFIENVITEDGEIYCSYECLEANQVVEAHLSTMRMQVVCDEVDKNFDTAEFIEISIVNEKITQFLNSEKMFHTPQGHGFAAEEGNTLLDKLRGKKAEVIGYDNAKDGADRLVERTRIQSKYCKTGEDSIKACFDDNGIFRYIEKNGKIMKIEVPKEQYNVAKKLMEKKILDGRIPGVTDPKMAGRIVKQGHLTYTQAKNITQFGTIESVGFDVVNGVIIGRDAGSLSFVASFASAIWKGEGFSKALNNSLLDGAKTIGSTAVVTTASSQIIKTEIGRELNLLAAKGISAAGLSKVMGSASPITTMIQVFAMTFSDFCKFVDGKLSGGELLKITTQNIASVAGSFVGAGLGAIVGQALASSAIGGVATTVATSIAGRSVGAALGSVIPVVGTIAGGIIGGIIANSLFDNSEKEKRAIEEQRREQQMQIDELNAHLGEMYKIFRTQFGFLAEQYMLTEKEAEEVLDMLKQNNLTARLIEMHEADNRISYAVRTIKPCVISIVSKRQWVSLSEPIAI